MQKQDMFSTMKDFFVGSPARKKRGVGLSTRSFALKGTLRSGKESIFSVDGQDFVTTSDTWTFGTVNLGATVFVQGVVLPDGTYSAKKISQINR